eukprot:jgi/Bigna1/91956/estExt_fgenesh1_pg.C_1360012
MDATSMPTGLCSTSHDFPRPSPVPCANRDEPDSPDLPGFLRFQVSFIVSEAFLIPKSTLGHQRERTRRMQCAVSWPGISPRAASWSRGRGRRFPIREVLCITGASGRFTPSKNLSIDDPFLLRSAIPANRCRS